MGGQVFHVARSSDGSMNTLDRRVCLPVIDGHCHVFGLSMLKGEELHPLAKADKVVFVQAGTDKIWATDAPVWLNNPPDVSNAKSEPSPWFLRSLSVVELSERLFDTARLTQVRQTVFVRSGEFKVLGQPRRLNYWKPLLRFSGGAAVCLNGTPARFGRLANSNDGMNAWRVLRGIPDTAGRGKAAVPLHMDMGYVPLEMGHIAEKLLPIVTTTEPQTADETQTTVSPGATEYYISDPELKADADLNRWLWYDKSHYMWTVYELANVCKRFPGQMWPFIHFDPRRARDEEMTKKDGRTALEIVEMAIKDLGFVGVKTYTRLGWVPWGNKEFYGETVGGELDLKLEAMYTYCVKVDLPIMSHMSPSGFPPSGEPDGWTRPNGMLVYPKEFHERPRGLAPDTPDKSNSDSIDEEHWKAAKRGMEIAFNYGHYLQTAVSPYAWEKVLLKHNTLRLCLAHAGTAASLLIKYYSTISEKLLKELPDVSPEIKSEEPRDQADHSNNAAHSPKFLESDEYNFMLFHCCVAGGEDYVNRWFPEFAATCGAAWLCEDRAATALESAVKPFESSLIKVKDLINAKKRKKAEMKAEMTKMKVAVKAIMSTAPWTRRMDDWRKDYEHDWLTKTIELMKYPNVYTDISCLCAGSSKEVFKVFFQALVDDMNGEGVAKILRDRLIFGTDWYMTESNRVSASQFWDRITSVVPESTSLFYRCSTLNTLRYLNLSPQKPGKAGGPEEYCRMKSMERRYADAFNRDKPDKPDWWEDVKWWYQKQASE